MYDWQISEIEHRALLEDVSTYIVVISLPLERQGFAHCCDDFSSILSLVAWVVAGRWLYAWMLFSLEADAIQWEVFLGAVVCSKISHMEIYITLGHTRMYIYIYINICIYIYMYISIGLLSTPLLICLAAYFNSEQPAIGHFILQTY